ncbi:MAG: hypothetical protein MSIBF_04105 [Candidatus Altiarchaeales archaeon IMC4]|nr:MAG: hypothetical protein MSIBF_04105 [Candidatus Altiarchaeales archaeon IMC4]
MDLTTIAVSLDVKKELDKLKGNKSYNEVILNLLETSVLSIEAAIEEITESELKRLRDTTSHLHERMENISVKDVKR